jgi:hypothetical protein
MPQGADLKCVTKQMLMFLHLACFLWVATAQAMNGITADELKNIRLKTGKNLVTTPQGLGTLQRQYTDLSHINEQTPKVLTKVIGHMQFLELVSLLPPEFHHEHVLALAETIGFDDTDDEESFAKNYIRLALLIRDMYDPHNAVAQRFGLALTPKSLRLSKHQIDFLVAESFERALRELSKVTRTHDEEDAIDFHLSLAQLAIWRLHAQEQSKFARLLDFTIEHDHVVIGAQRDELIKQALSNLDLVESMLNNPHLNIPTIYNSQLYHIAENLSKDQIFELALLHKGELDEERANDEDDLQKAQGFAAQDLSILDYFSSEKLAQIKAYAQHRGIPDEYITKFVTNTMKNYVTNKITRPALYFNQDVLQRYLVKTGVVTREDLTATIFSKIQIMRQHLSI